VIPKTYLGCVDFSQHRTIYKYLFVAFTTVELLLVPNMLALPILFLFLILMIFAVMYTTKEINSTSATEEQFIKDSDYTKAPSFEDEKSNLVEWAMKNERLFTITMEWQKVFMMIQLFEFVLVNTYSVKQELRRELNGQSSFSFLFFILRLIGHAEY